MQTKSNRFPRLGLLALALSGTLSFSVQAEPLTFKQIVEKTLSQNPNMQVSEARINQAQAALSKAESSRLPQIKLSMTGSASNNALNVFGMKLQQRQATFADFGAEEFTGPSALGVAPEGLNEPGSHTDLNTRLEVMVPVWNGGKIGYYQDQARAMIRAAQEGDQATQQFLIFNVYKAYEAVHAARAYISVAEQAKKTADEFVRTTRNLVEQGVIVRSEYLSAKVNQSNAEVALMKAQTQEQMALDGLKVLMAMNMDADLDIADQIDMGINQESASEILQSAMQSNPELQALREQVAAELEAVNVEKSAKLPSFNVMLRQDWNDESIGLDSSSYTVAGVASWTITDFGLTDNSIAMARAASAQKKAELQARESEVRLSVYEAWRNLKVAQQQVRSNSLAVEQATKALELIKRRFESGVATITEVLVSQTQLDKANAEWVTAKYEVKVQKAKLRLLAGMMKLDQI